VRRPKILYRILLLLNYIRTDDSPLNYILQLALGVALQAGR